MIFDFVSGTKDSTSKGKFLYVLHIPITEASNSEEIFLSLLIF
jgi:hypothetical protein